MNPPYPHKKTDTPTEAFVERALEGLSQGARLAAIIPLSLLVKSNKASWRKSILKNNTLEAAIKLPDELFQPYAQPYTVIVYLRKGVPHPKGKRAFFARIENDGFRIRKGVRVACPGSELPKMLTHFRAGTSEPGVSGWAEVDEDASFGPGAYIPAKEMTPEASDEAAQEVIRARTSFVAYHAADLVQLYTDNPLDIRAMRRKPWQFETVKPGTVAAYFDIYYGQKELHSKDGLLPGHSLVISSSKFDNGCYGLFDFEHILKPPFVTVPGNGSIAYAHVQEWPCGVSDDCMLLLPKEGVPHSLLYVAAAAIRNERWRFSYGRKATPDRIADFPVPHTDELLLRVEDYLSRAARIEDQMIEDAEDAFDSHRARTRISEIKAGTVRLVSGTALDQRLAALLDD
jgi:hypothetical protein